MLKDFRDWIMRPTLIEIAVGLVMALALGALVTALIENIIMPIVGIIFGEPTFDDALILTINGSEIRFGAFLTALVAFVSLGFAVYFFIIKPYEAYQARKGATEEEEPDPEDVVLLRQIRDELQRQR